jgi:hypothetical protein
LLTRDELWARYRSRFIASARTRIARTRASGADTGVIASELHALAGEAALLELVECARLARAAGDHARAGERRACESVVSELEGRIGELA